MLVARDGVHFARLACDLSRVPGLAVWMLGIYVVCLMAGLTVALSGSLDAAWICGTHAVLSGFWFRSLNRQDHGMDTTLGWWRRQMLLTMLMASALGAAWLLGADRPAAVKATGTMMGAVVAL